jgi:hypothetical protein
VESEVGAIAGNIVRPISAVDSCSSLVGWTISRGELSLVKGLLAGSRSGSSRTSILSLLVHVYAFSMEDCGRDDDWATVTASTKPEVSNDSSDNEILSRFTLGT